VAFPPLGLSRGYVIMSFDGAMSEIQLVKYTAAKQALAEAHSVDEVREVLNQTRAMELYAVIADDIELSRQATEIWLRAEKRLGEMMAEQKTTVGMAKGGEHYHQEPTGVDRTPVVPTLEDAGIDKNLAKRARKAAAMSEEKYEAKISRQIALAEAAASATGKAVAVQSYAQQRGDAHLFFHATKIRMRAEKRWGELYTPNVKAKGTKGQLAGGGDPQPPAKMPTLEDNGRHQNPIVEMAGACCCSASHFCRGGGRDQPGHKAQPALGISAGA
jgi:hypothetical protein